MQKDRVIVIDIMRGGAVIATLLAHAQQRALSLEGIFYPDNLLTHLIYPWYMTSFILLSGYTLGMGESFHLWKKFKRLVIPTFVWSFVLYLIHDFSFVGIKWYFDFDAYTPLEYLQMLCVNPTYVIWFLWIVFLLASIMCICHWIVMVFYSKSLTCDLEDKSHRDAALFGSRHKDADIGSLDIIDFTGQDTVTNTDLERYVGGWSCLQAF